ncbi:flagellin [Ferrimonas balearica]|uniref:flagellin N-terminal helical domain-containing protein n=1 Tax=Ferrimonas balearica TaxID=44012 RepID=UPI001C95444D|nr:flagellin [Ferrimonas balearica]MBY5980697.1 Lateral flagellin [Ferrimonas balearica]
MLSIQTNYNSLVAQNNLGKSNSAMGTAMERLSTGFRINSAKDDAAGLQIANRMEANSRGMSVAMRNGQDAIGMMQIAEGGMDEITNIALRMKDLATQSANGTNSAADKDALDAEFQELTAEVTRIMGTTEFNGNNVFTAFTGGVTFQIGGSTNANDKLTVTADTTDITTALAGLAIGDGDDTDAAIDGVVAAIDAVNAHRSTLGANINRVEHTINNLSSVVENTEAAKGRIMDTDFAVETANMTKNQLLVQAGTNILAQSNQMGGLVMGLL